MFDILVQSVERQFLLFGVFEVIQFEIDKVGEKQKKGQFVFFEVREIVECLTLGF